jgi:hypothetical protein
MTEEDTKSKTVTGGIFLDKQLLVSQLWQPWGNDDSTSGI